MGGSDSAACFVLSEDLDVDVRPKWVGLWCEAEEAKVRAE